MIQVPKLMISNACLVLAATGADFGHSFLPTFQSSFYYAWLQGALPLNGGSLAARQCLIGGNCE